MYYKILDDFLPSDQADKIEHYLTGSLGPTSPQPPMRWSFINGISYENDGHTFFGSVPYSQPWGIVLRDQYEYFIPLIEQLKYKALVRVKLNCYPKTENLVFHSKHVDFNYEHFSGIYYANSNNGFTILEDGTKIESIKNRFLMTDGSKPHSSTNCTDKPIRVTVNINWLGIHDLKTTLSN